MNGSLENSEKKDACCNTVLESQGICDYVFAILEGGDNAFK